MSPPLPSPLPPSIGAGVTVRLALSLLLVDGPREEGACREAARPGIVEKIAK